MTVNKQEKKKPTVVELGVTRAAQLFRVSERTIQLRCESKKLVATQDHKGASWRVFLPTHQYEELKRRLELINNN